MEHDEKKIEKILKNTNTENFVDWQREAMKQYAEHYLSQYLKKKNTEKNT